MGISGRDLAILSARFGTARFGASRFGFCPEDVEGAGTDEPGEYVWKEHKPATTVWTLQGQCEGNVCGWKPAALFSAVLTYASLYAGISAEFADESTPTNDVDSWSWDFGDSSSSTEQNPDHTYTSSIFDQNGVYNVTLTATNSKGTGSVTGTIIAGLVTYRGEGDLAWEGVAVSLVDSLGATVDTAVTDADGFYAFLVFDADDYIPTVYAQAPPVGADQSGNAGTITVPATGAATANITCTVGG